MKNHNCPDEGFVHQITLPNGKFIFLGIISPTMKKVRELGLENTLVQYITDSCHSDINKAIHQGQSVRINGFPAADFLEKIANAEEYKQFIEKLN